MSRMFPWARKGSPDSGALANAGSGSKAALAPPPVNLRAANEVAFADVAIDTGREGPGFSSVTDVTTFHAESVSEEAVTVNGVRIANHFSTFADVPSGFSHLLSAGDEPMVRLGPVERSHMVVIALGGKNALVVHANAAPELLESTLGKVQGNGFAAQVVTAEPSVITSIYQAGDIDSGEVGRGAVNKYMAAIDEWVEYAVKNKATDIHVERLGKYGAVRFRIDGELEPMRAHHEGKYTGPFIEECMGTLFNNENQAKSGSQPLFHAEKNLYCMVPYRKIPGHALKLRYQSIKGNTGPKNVLRLLPTEENQPVFTFKDQGYADSHIALLTQTMETPTGIVLFSGVTGSGKSTALKTFIETNPAAPASAIYTIEDPIEYVIRHTHQIHVQRDLTDPEGSAKLFAEIIATLLRSDPDIVVMGEVRDRPSANALQQLAQTGALSAGTLHVNQIAIMVPRLVDPEIGLTRASLTAPGMLTLLVYQALVPVLCPHCKETTETAALHNDRVAFIAQKMDELGTDCSGMRWKHVGGCSHCNYRGTAGVTVVAEMLMPDDDWLREVREGRDGAALEVYRSYSDGDLLSPNMDGKTVFEHTLFKALHGLVDARQCARFEPWPKYVTRELRRRQARASLPKEGS